MRSEERRNRLSEWLKIIRNCYRMYLNEVDEGLTNFHDAHIALLQRRVKFGFVEISYTMHIAEHAILLASQFGRHVFVIESLHETVDAEVQRPNVNLLVAQQLLQGVRHLTAKYNSKYAQLEWMRAIVA